MLDPTEGAYPNFFEDFTTDCINAVYGDTLFVSINENDYQLDTLSIAEEAAKVINGISLDLLNRARDATNPDIGCFEYQYE